jgi:hypothetical protein
MPNIIGVHAFKRSKLKMILAGILIISFIGISIFINVLTGFNSSSVIVSILLCGGLLFLLRNFFKPNLFISDDGIIVKNDLLGKDRQLQWSQIEMAEYKYVAAGRHQLAFFVLWVTSSSKSQGFPTTFNITAADYTNEDICKIASLFAAKIGKDKLADNVLDMLN